MQSLPRVRLLQKSRMNDSRLTFEAIETLTFCVRIVVEHRKTADVQRVFESKKQTLWFSLTITSLLSYSSTGPGTPQNYFNFKANRII
jgi:hypothetical protein